MLTELHSTTELGAPTQTERNWAMLAHLTVLVTVGAGAVTNGAGAVVALLLPLGLYLYFGTRSRYVAFHALQATVFQAVGAIAFVVTAAAAGAAIAAAWVVAGVLSLVLVGLLLLPVALVLTAAGGFALAALPIVLVAYMLYGAYQAYEGHEFRYPWIGEIVARTMRPAGVPA